MSAEVGASRSILTRRAVPQAIRQRGFQAIVIRPADVGDLVYDNARQMLANALPHDPRFAMVYEEAFLQSGRAHVQLKPLDDALEVAIARERQVVCVPRVICAGGLGQSE